MATNYTLMVKSLLDFYNFENKTIICIGAGGGQFIGYGQSAKKIIAIDIDTKALDDLRIAVERNNMSDKYEFILCDFLTKDLAVLGDVALFEYCLHEMTNPVLALNRAGKIARDVVIIDHGLRSEWAYYVAEEEKVRASWQAVKRFKESRHKEHSTEHKFKNYEELLNKVMPQGDIAIQRIEKFKDKLDISILVTYELALINFH
jgi:hypothetical protein